MNQETNADGLKQDFSRALSACDSQMGCPLKYFAAIGFVDDRPFMINTQRVGIGQRLFIDGQDIGRLSEVRPDRIFVKNEHNISTCYKIGSPDFALITTSPPSRD
jgi:hypothetical protein